MSELQRHRLTRCLSLVRLPCLGAALLAWLALSGAGCNSLSQPDPAGFASVTISGCAPQAIADAICQVFGADGYAGGVTGRGELVFEKLASRATTVAREGIIGAQSGAQTVNRVRVEVIAVDGARHRVQCQAYVVRGGSDPFFQDEVALAKARSGPYQELLEKVVKQLEPSKPPTSTVPAGS